MKNSIVTIAIVLANLFSSNAFNGHTEGTNIPNPNIVGYFNFDQLMQPPHDTWFLPEYKNYVVDSLTLNKINTDIISDLKFTTVMGVWCSDSKREVPRFVKIIEYLNLNEEQIVAIGVDQKKEAENTNVNELNIELVPTIIVYYKENEIGRIIESPKESLEKDILNIVAKIDVVQQ